ncbi:MAG: DUF2027 domain-containing protein [Prevotella sp.]|nr:DUF2027 domain-containing protein [Prevotella sp.]
MKIGDKVRFLNETGGGRISGFRDNNVVLVEDEDGFEVPMLKSEVVVIGEEDYDTKHVVEVKQKGAGATPASTASAPHPAGSAQAPAASEKSYANLLHQPVERKGGDQLSLYLAYVPIDVKQFSQTRFEVYVVNDSNYYVRFVYLTAEGAGWRLRATAEVEPNTKQFVEEVGREELGQMERICMQLLAYKRDKTFLTRPVVDVKLRIDSVKFYKLHAFRENDFFEQASLLYPIVENDRPARSLVIDAQQLKENMYQKPEEKPKRPLVAPARKDGSGDEPLVIDLHADEILDNTNGLSPVDILNYQLDVFRKTLKEHERHKGMKIVFIHGKGEGVLRRALLNELQYRYKQYTHQDASFQEYGYGATQVTIK